MHPATGAVRDPDAELLALREPLRRFTRAHLRDGHDADDVVQETLARVLAARDRLGEGALPGYAFAVARNLIAGQHRDVQRQRRNAPRLHDPTQPERPEEPVLAAEERRALASAVAALPQEQRRGLLAHELHDQPLIDRAEATGSTPSAVAAQLSRTRARVRLDYLLALRRVELPTPRCRPVLLALSAGDRRRQAALGAGRHLLTCRTCAEVSEPLVSRKRALAGLLPWLPLAALKDRLLRAARHRGVQATAATVVAGTVLATVTLGGGRSHAPAATFTPAASPTRAAATASRPATAPAAPWMGELSAPGRSLLPLPPALARLAGQPVLARGVRVLDVPADEGFWVGRDARNRIWVQLTGRGESPERIRRGARVWFRGRLVRHDARFAARVGVEAADGAAQLIRQGVHIDVPGDRVTER